MASVIHLLHGDCVEQMRLLAENSVDAIVTDPPYDLTTEPPHVASGGYGGQRTATQKAARKGFMGKSWDGTGVAFDPATWTEALRVLKPGGHLLAFGGTRTYHRMACAIEDAGFEIRDQLQWLYGSGFPKSLDVSKAIDKAAGATREVAGEYAWPDGNPRNTAAHTTKRSGIYSDIKTDDAPNSRALTMPATPEAAQWDGWGTALKPANEPIVLARKPLSEPTVAANVLKWSTGALNIDACRVVAHEQSRSGEAGIGGTNRTRDSLGDVSSVRSRIQGTEEQTRPYKGQDMQSRLPLGGDEWGEQRALGGREIHGRAGLHPHQDGERLHAGAPAGDGTGARAGAGSGRSGASHQRESSRQPTGESEALRQPGDAHHGEPRDAGQQERAHGLPQGRWPSNLILSHHPACVPVGTRRVKGSRIDKPSTTGQMQAFAGGGLGGDRPARGIGDADGYETVEAWDCAPDCPVRLLDEQSVRSTSPPIGSRGGGSASHAVYGDYAGVRHENGYGDTGGASRFFKTVNYTEEECSELASIANQSSTPLRQPDDSVRAPAPAVRGQESATHSASTSATLNVSSASAANATPATPSTEHASSSESRATDTTETRSHVSNAAQPTPTVTMTTTPSREMSDGSVVPAIPASMSSSTEHGEADSAVRFRYVAKASRAERDAGLKGLPLFGEQDEPLVAAGGLEGRHDGSLGSVTHRRNHHPTVKPVALMQYLLALVTPPGGVALDPFAGSGSTGVACARLGIDAVLIEREDEYLAIIRRRLAHAGAEVRDGAP